MRAILKKRKRSRAGFSLAETLIAILILLMVSAIVAGAIPAASNVYAKTVDAANAQVLLSTAITVLRDELGTAVSVKPDGTTAITYMNGNDGYRKIASIADPKGIMLYVGTVDPTSGVPEFTGESRPLVSGKATTRNLVLSFESVEYTGGMVIFKELKVERNGVTLASRDSLRIRTIK